MGFCKATFLDFTPSAGPHFLCFFFHSAYYLLFLQQSRRGYDDVGLTGCGLGFISLHSETERQTALKVRCLLSAGLDTCHHSFVFFFSRGP